MHVVLDERKVGFEALDLSGLEVLEYLTNDRCPNSKGCEGFKAFESTLLIREALGSILFRQLLETIFLSDFGELNHDFHSF